jgi:lipopolysaccharide export system protein LptC
MTRAESESDGLLANTTRTQASYRMGAWKDSPREVLKSAWRYSIFVRVMKGALPITALGLGVAVLVYIVQPRDTSRVALTFEQLGRVEDDLTMVKPQLTGTDDDGLPFKVTAASAVQTAPGSDTIRLQDVIADIALKDGRTLHVVAAKGLADTKNHHLEVSGGIHLTSNDGYDAKTESASADLKTGTIKGDSPIEASGTFGQVTARRFALNKTNGKLQFSGNVHMVLNPLAQTP